LWFVCPGYLIRYRAKRKANIHLTAGHTWRRETNSKERNRKEENEKEGTTNHCMEKLREREKKRREVAVEKRDKERGRERKVSTKFTSHSYRKHAM